MQKPDGVLYPLPPERAEGSFNAMDRSAGHSIYIVNP